MFLIINYLYLIVKSNNMESREEESLHKFLYGSESADRFDRFTKGLMEIEKKYSDFFKERKARNYQEEDRLGYHYVIQFNNNYTRFDFLKDSDIPEVIKIECGNLFNQIYNGN